MKIKILSLFILPSILLGNTNIVDSYVDQFNLEKTIINKESTINENSWIGDVNLSYQANGTDNNKYTTSDSYKLSYNQDVFNFGGIKYGIDYFKIQKELSLLSLDSNIINLENNIILNILNLKIINNNIKINNLSLENLNIQYNILKDNYILGESNIIDLNDKILSINNIKNQIQNLNQQKNDILEYLSTYSKIKDFDLINNKIEKSEYLSKNINIQNQTLNYELNKVNNKLTRSSFLPKFSIGYDFTRSNQNEYQNTHNIYLKVNIPFSFTESKQLELAKIKELKSKQNLDLIKNEEEIKYNTFINNLDIINNKINTSNENIIVYDDLLKIINDNINGGLKTENDRIIMNNNKNIEKFNILNYELEKQSIYYKIKLNMY